MFIKIIILTTGGHKKSVRGTATPPPAARAEQPEQLVFFLSCNLWGKQKTEGKKDVTATVNTLSGGNV